ncbi:MAG: hypothetical protein ACXV9T_10500, partial [Methylobacter sp.]
GYPLPGIQRMKQDGWGRRRHWLPRNFCRLLGLGCPKQAFAKIAALSMPSSDLRRYVAGTIIARFTGKWNFDFKHFQVGAIAQAHVCTV